MMNQNKSIFIFVFFLICLSFRIYNLEVFVSAADVDDSKTINIFAVQPGMPETLDVEKWEMNYENSMNKYFSELAASNPNLEDVKLSFYFYEYEPVNTTNTAVYNRYLQDFYPGCMDGIYDLMILDDRTLFNEMAFMETDYIFAIFEYQYPSLEIATDVTQDFKLVNNDIYDPKILEDGKYKGKVYGLPYEIDFDLIYYKDNNIKAKELVTKMSELTWDELINELMPVNSMSIALGNDNDLVNFFIEYVGNHHELTKEANPKFYETFYNENSDKLYHSFYDLVMKYSHNNFINETLYLSQDEAYNNFMSDKSTFFKARASDSALFNSPIIDEKTNTTFTVIPYFPPKMVSTFMEKFLVVNKKSTKDKKMLKDAAILLTSKEMQLFRAKNFGSIPAFNFAKKDSHPEIKSYCQSQSFLCNIITSAKKLYLKDVFKSEYSVPMYEMMALFPLNLKRYLKNNDVELIKFIMTNTYELITMHLGIYGVLSKIIVWVAVALSSVVMFLVYKHRNHPYLKAISPLFCNMIILGCMMNMIKVLQHLPPYSEFKGKFFFMFETLTINLIYIPMFAVTYRIYKIFKAKFILSKALDNTRLFMIVVSIMLISVVFRGYIIFVENFFYMPYGSIKSPRFPEWNYHNYEKYSSIYEAYMHGIFIALLFMIITTGQFSQKFGDVCYTFIIFILNISDFIVIRLLNKLSHENFEKFFLLIIIFNTFTCALCIYILVGSRLLFIILFPSELSNKSFNSSDLSDFVPIISKKKYLNIIENLKKLKTFNSSNNSSISKMNNSNFSKSPSSNASYKKINNNNNNSYTFLGKSSNLSNSSKNESILIGSSNGNTIGNIIGSPGSSKTYMFNDSFNSGNNQNYNANQNFSKFNYSDSTFMNNYPFTNFERFNSPTNKPNTSDYKQFE